MDTEDFTRADELKHKEGFKGLYFESLDAFIPKYITHANKEISYYKDVKKDMQVVFDKHFGLVDKEAFQNEILLVIKENIKKYNFTPRGEEYLDYFIRQVGQLTRNTLYKTQFINLIEYYENSSEKLKKETIEINLKIKKANEPLLKNIGQKIISLRAVDSINKNDILRSLQRLRERFGIEILIANNIAWPNVAKWVKNMEIILPYHALKMGIPENSLVNERLTIICCERYNSNGGLFSPLSKEKEIIQITLENLEQMSRIWFHEYTHYLDYKAGEFFCKKQAARFHKTQIFLSEFLFFRSTPEGISEAGVNMVEKTQKFLRTSFGLSEQNFFEQTKKAKESFEHLKDYFLISFFDVLKNDDIVDKSASHEHFNIENISLLKLDSHAFLSQLLLDVYSLPYRAHKSFVKHFAQNNEAALTILKNNIQMFHSKLGISPEQAVEVANYLDNPKFIDNFVKAAKHYISHEGIICFQYRDDLFFIKCQNEMIKRSLKTENPDYWARIVEIFARTIEIVHPTPEDPSLQKKKKASLFNFHILGNATITQELQNKSLNTMEHLYLSPQAYTQTMKKVIHEAFQSMHAYINEQLLLELHSGVKKNLPMFNKEKNDKITKSIKLN